MKHAPEIMALAKLPLPETKSALAVDVRVSHPSILQPSALGTHSGAPAVGQNFFASPPFLLRTFLVPGGCHGMCVPTLDRQFVLRSIDFFRKPCEFRAMLGVTRIF